MTKLCVFKCHRRPGAAGRGVRAGRRLRVAPLVDKGFPGRGLCAGHPFARHIRPHRKELFFLSPPSKNSSVLFSRTKYNFVMQQDGERCAPCVVRRQAGRVAPDTYAHG